MPTVDEMLADARAALDRVTPETAPAALASGAVLVDIRSDEQRARDGVVPGAVRIPRNVLEWRADPASDVRDPRISDPATPVILLCDGGYQSSLAAATLQKLGLPLATDLAGGFQAWRAAGTGAAGATVSRMLPRSLAVALEWLGEGRRVVSATLVESIGSAPLEPGAEMLVDDTGRIEGSVTGGCVEGALVEEAQGVLAGAPPRVATYGISDEQAVGVGLMCGGTVRVFVAEITAPDVLAAVRAEVEAERPVALATLLDGPAAGATMAVLEDRCAGSLGPGDLLDANVARDARGFLDEGRSAVRRYSAKGETMGSDLRVAIRAFATPPRMVIFGAIDFSAALAAAATEIGYCVTIVDARQAFAASTRFSEHAEVVVSWPQAYLAQVTLGPRDAVLVFTHDPKFDEPALTGALATGAGYIGALGSRRTHADREERLRAAGITDDQLARISSPCGLDVGARTPAETAVAVLAEILALRAGRAGGRLADATGPIHSATTPVA